MYARIEYLLVAALILQVVDALTTAAILKHPNGREANPVMRWLMLRMGTQPALVLAKASSCALAIGLYAQLNALGLLMFCAAYVVIALNNWRVMRALKVS